MRKYYYEVIYQTARYAPSNSKIITAESMADAKLHCYAILNAYDINSIRRTFKP